MKKIVFLFTILIIICQSNLEAQRNKQLLEKSTSSSTQFSQKELERIPFSRGVWEIATLKPNLQASRSDVEFNGNDAGSLSNFFFDAGANYYVADGFGVGAELLYNVNTSKNNSTKTVNTNWMTFANLTYGINVNKDLNVYARFGAGVGGVVNKYTATNGNTTKNTADLTGLKFAIGGPIRIDRNFYFTPELGWRRNREKFDGGVEIENRFGVNLGFTSFLGCSKASCDDTRDYRKQHTMYQPGRSFLGVSTLGGFNFGNNKIEYDNNTPDVEQNYTGYDLSANYNYFVARDFAIGLGGSISGSHWKSDMTNSSNKYFGFLFGPMVQWNIPSQNHFVNDFFLVAGAGVGTRRTENKSGTFSSTIKYNTSDVYGGIGHNCFFSRKLALTTTLQYDWFTVKNKENDNKEKFNGLNLTVGINKYFD